MALTSRHVLELLGYSVDKRGNISNSTNQLAIVTLEREFGGGVLRVHGAEDQFFYAGDPTLEQKELLFPLKLTSRYVYFQGKNERARVDSTDFLDNTLRAFVEFNKLRTNRLAG